MLTMQNNQTNDEKGKTVLLSQWKLDGWVSHEIVTKRSFWGIFFFTIFKRKIKSRQIMNNVLDPHPSLIFIIGTTGSAGVIKSELMLKFLHFTRFSEKMKLKTQKNQHL